MPVTSVNNNDLNFGGLRIKINGEAFKKRPEDAKLLKNTIRNDENITDFFKHHRGKIVVRSGETQIKEATPYPAFLRRIHGIAETFNATYTVPTINLKCTYSRAFALRNLFRKPVWIEMGNKPNKFTKWSTCMKDALELIKSLGADTPEAIAKRGDIKPRDLFSVEAKRLKVEKP